MACLTHPSRIVMLILEWISMATSFSPVVPLFTQVFQIDLRLRLTRNAHNKEVSRSLPPKIDTTLYGLVDQPFHPSPPSRASGSPRKNTRRTVPKSSTENAYEQIDQRITTPTTILS